jgi:hypothetical protein
MNRTNQPAGCRRYEISNHSTSLAAAPANSQPGQLEIVASSRKLNQLRNSNSQLFPCLQMLGEMMTAKGKAAGTFATLSVNGTPFGFAQGKPALQRRGKKEGRERSRSLVGQGAASVGMTAKGKAAGTFAALRMTILIGLSLLVRGGVAAGGGFAGALFDG